MAKLHKKGILLVDDDLVSMQSIFVKEPCLFDLVDWIFLINTDKMTMEFMNMRLWMAGQENFDMADAKGIYRTYPPMLLVLSTEEVKMCCRDTEYY